VGSKNWGIKAICNVEAKSLSYAALTLLVQGDFASLFTTAKAFWL
jgi:hypothetical protein